MQHLSQMHELAPEIRAVLTEASRHAADVTKNMHNMLKDDEASAAAAAAAADADEAAAAAAAAKRSRSAASASSSGRGANRSGGSGSPDEDGQDEGEDEDEAGDASSSSTTMDISELLQGLRLSRVQVSRALLLCNLVEAELRATGKWVRPQPSATPYSPQYAGQGGGGGGGPPSTDKQRRMIYALTGKKNMSEEQKAKVQRELRFDTNSLHKLSVKEASAVIDALKKRQEAGTM